MTRPRLIALVGPTAAGKTPLAVELARRLDAEIVSVDSRQVYRHLDVGTAKPDAAARAAIPHHLLDVIEPDAQLDAARFAALGHAAIAGAIERGRRVVLCGGSGLYLRALTEGLCALPPADRALRRRLQCEAENRGALALHERLQAADPAAAGRIAPRDTLRVVRALEVHELTGRPLSEWQAGHAFSDRPYDVLTFVLSPPTEVLEHRIAERTTRMWASGLLEEAEHVLALGFSPELPALRAIGYREAIRHLGGEIDAGTALGAVVLSTRRYAKRQRTWFRRLSDAIRLDGGEDSHPGRLAARALEFLDAANLS
jgi:tRNA dimethylallyltransferase